LLNTPWAAIGLSECPQGRIYPGTPALTDPGPWICALPPVPLSTFINFVTIVLKNPKSPRNFFPKGW